MIVRFDAHAEMPETYLAACVRTLENEDGAANVGGWRTVRAEGRWGQALALALASRFGVGNARIWRSPRPGDGRRDVDTVPLGCFWAETLRRAGGWDEGLLANEDFDLNHRLRRGGGRVVFDPEIRSVYRPRESLGEIAAQYRRYGRWKAAMLAGAPGSVRPRQLVPPALARGRRGGRVPLAARASGACRRRAVRLDAHRRVAASAGRLAAAGRARHDAPVLGGGASAGLARHALARGGRGAPGGPSGQRAQASP